MKASVDSKIAKYLLDVKLLDQFQYRAVQDHQMKGGGRFHVSVMELGFVPEDRVMDAVSKVLGMPKVDLFKLQMDADALNLLDGAFCIMNTIYPCALRDGGSTLWLAMADPFSTSVLQQARKKSQKAVINSINGTNNTANSASWLTRESLLSNCTTAGTITIARKSALDENAIKIHSKLPAAMKMRRRSP